MRPTTLPIGQHVVETADRRRTNLFGGEIDRSTLDREMVFTSKVEGTGKISVDVRAPPARGSTPAAAASSRKSR
jgi:hypothetical protein